MSVFKLASLSFKRYLDLAYSDQVHLYKEALGSTYAINQHGVYSVFRDTYQTDQATKDEVVLVVGFRLKLLRNNNFGHWLFRCVSILTTPFWLGFEGFRIKLWMVDIKTKDYLGVYKWSGKKNAQIYIDALLKVLRPLSTHGSVWYELYPMKFEDFINQHYQSLNTHKESVWLKTKPSKL